MKKPSMNYLEAKRLLNHALENQKTIQISKLQEIVTVMKSHKKSELQYYKDKSLNSDRRLNEMKNRTNSVVVVKSRDGIPSVVQINGVHYMRNTGYITTNSERG